MNITTAVSISIHAILTVLEGLLLLISVLVAMGLECINVQTHVSGNATLSSSLWEAGLGVDNGGTALGGLYQLRILFLKNGKVPLSLPVPARTSKGKISAGYNHGTVSHVAPNVAVKRKIMATAPELAPRAAGEPTGCWRPIVASPPASNIEIPWTMEPQYSVQRRPILSKVKTQMRVASCL